MAVGDVYIIKMKQTYFLQNLMNTFYYRMTVDGGAPNPAQALFDEFDDTCLSIWDGTVGNSITIDYLEVFNIRAPTEFYQATPTNNIGARVFVSDERAPSWVAYGARSNRNGPGTRSSYKRFAGIGEPDINANSLSATFLALPAVTNFLNSLKNVLNDGFSSWEPVQVQSGWQLGFNPTVNFVIATWGTPYLTSQVSRRP